MIKGFLFDYDGVMTAKSGGNNPSELLGRLLDMSGKEIGEFFMTFWPDYLRGKINEPELWRMIEAKSGKEIPPHERKIWTTWEQLKPIPEMQQLVRSLKAKGYPVGLLTNVTPTTEEEVRTHSGYEGFDFLIRSCKVGAAKPDAAIYKMALQYFPGRQAKEIVFIDDRERFLMAASQHGMQTILAISADQVIRDVNALIKL